MAYDSKDYAQQTNWNMKNYSSTNVLYYNRINLSCGTQSIMLNFKYKDIEWCYIKTKTQGYNIKLLIRYFLLLFISFSFYFTSLLLFSLSCFSTWRDTKSKQKQCKCKLTIQEVIQISWFVSCKKSLIWQRKEKWSLEYGRYWTRVGLYLNMNNYEL